MELVPYHLPSEWQRKWISSSRVLIGLMRMALIHTEYMVRTFSHEYYRLIRNCYVGQEKVRISDNMWSALGSNSRCNTIIFSPICNQYNKHTTFWMLPIKIHIRCKTVLLTGQQFIDLLPAIEQLLTDGLIFIGSISHVILMLIKIKKKLKKWRCLTKQLLRATDPFSGQTKLLLSSNPVNSTPNTD